MSGQVWVVPIIVAFIGLTGVGITHLYSRKRELEKQLVDKKRDIYSKFISSFYDYFYDIASEKKTSKQRDEELQKALKKFATDITLYGAPPVIKAFNRFRLSGMRQQKQQQSQHETQDFSVLAYFGDFPLAIRRDMGLSNKSLTSKELFQIFLTEDASKLPMTKI